MRVERRTAASLSYVLSGTSAVVVVSLILFYAIELPTGRLHVFGPLSDICRAPASVAHLCGG